MGERIIKSPLTLSDRVERLAEKYQSVSRQRDTRLFTEFLLNGYRQTTLSSVDPMLLSEVLFAKVCLGSIITLYDDLADHPQLKRPKLLNSLYRLNVDETAFHELVSIEERPYLELAVHLFNELKQIISKLPHRDGLLKVLSFDIKHVFLANQYAELMGEHPQIRNLNESRPFGPYNMGMVAAGTIDLMASPGLDQKETGALRSIFIQGQRIGRIGNLISTYQREMNEGDLTNEMLLHPQGIQVAKVELVSEMHEKVLVLMGENDKIKTVDLVSYAQGLVSLFDLHQSMEGFI